MKLPRSKSGKGGRGYLDGQMLIAMPAMMDERFVRSLIYICAHSSEGAMGIIVNHPAPNINFSDLLVKLDVIPAADEGPDERERKREEARLGSRQPRANRSEQPARAREHMVIDEEARGLSERAIAELLERFDVSSSGRFVRVELSVDEVRVLERRLFERLRDV